MSSINDKLMVKSMRDKIEATVKDCRKLSTDEYLACLYQIQASGVIRLIEKLECDDTFKTGAYLNVIEKVHWLIDSVAPKVAAASADGHHVIKYAMELPSSTADA